MLAEKESLVAIHPYDPSVFNKLVDINETLNNLDDEAWNLASVLSRYGNDLMKVVGIARLHNHFPLKEEKLLMDPGKEAMTFEFRPARADSEDAKEAVPYMWKISLQEDNKVEVHPLQFLSKNAPAEIVSILQDRSTKLLSNTKLLEEFAEALKTAKLEDKLGLYVEYVDLMPGLTMKEGSSYNQLPDGYTLLETTDVEARTQVMAVKSVSEVENFVNTHWRFYNEVVTEVGAGGDYHAQM
eukprot:CAMPEP_0176440454 /NCGR_PEP_ID=MMETSP0127-20121128/20582_1 /TAXON_ID=938130 /ORGANISM="Platyophrya macrostoma, Strain WH" /LENGTH=240 /DNA_ID=CAMNT_0017824985 /DNA_START=18 /DNA_END=739 /DNA_ORIENTATION=-